MTEVELRNSERATFTQCPWKWDLAYNHRLRAKTSAPALRFGTLIHTALEKFYVPGVKRGPKPAETFEQEYERELKSQYKIGFRDEDGTWHEAGQLGVTMLEEYYRTYGKDERWRILASEIPFRVPVVDPLTGISFTYVGVMDILALDRESGKRRDIWIWDHKTTKDDPTKKGDVLVLDDQSGSYWSHGVDYLIAEDILNSRTHLTGMLYNFLRKGVPDERPRNKQGQYLNKPTKERLLAEAKRRGVHHRGNMTVAELMDIVPKAELLGEVSKVQPTPLLHREPVRRYAPERDAAKQRILAQARIMHYMRTGKLEIYKVPGTLHNPHCKWCEFRDMCELHEQGSDHTAMLPMYTTWEPYAQHEIEDGEKR